ncbi:LOW QUALITY PROTEIN: fibronectin type III domain-containing protein 11 [Phoenicopterus ruber ruber]
MHRTDILQIIDLCQFQRMKVVVKNQAEIQLMLLTELLEQLERGREELSCYVETCDMDFLSRGTRLPSIKLLSAQKMPLIFDRNESFACKDWVKLKWFYRQSRVTPRTV